MKTIDFNEVLSGKHFSEAEIIATSFLPVNLPDEFEIVDRKTKITYRKAEEVDMYYRIYSSEEHPVCPCCGKRTDIENTICSTEMTREVQKIIAMQQFAKYYK